MKKGIRFIGVFLIVSLWICSPLGMGLSPKEVLAEEPVTLTVYNPCGAFEVTQTFAPRVADLHGKTICELSNDSWEHARTFPAIRELLQRQFPTAKIITWDKFRHGNVAVTGIDSDDTVKQVKAAGCQAVIVGNAG
jgi:hypothetical protein